MIKITADQLLDYAKQLEVKELFTLHEQARFTVTFNDAGELFYTPLSTHEPRRHERKYLESVCEIFSNTNSLSPSDYNEKVFNGSYTLSVIAKYLGAIADGTVKR